MGSENFKALLKRSLSPLQVKPKDLKNS